MNRVIPEPGSRPLFLGVAAASFRTMVKTGKTSGPLRSSAVMAIKGVTVSTKKITRVPGEARPPL